MRNYYNESPEHNYAMNSVGFRNFILLLILVLIVSLILIFKHHGKLQPTNLDVYSGSRIACLYSSFNDSLYEQKAGS